MLVGYRIYKYIYEILEYKKEKKLNNFLNMKKKMKQRYYKNRNIEILKW